MSNEVMCISSYVCSGFVGNRCGMIILDHFQIQGIFVLTTHFSNHTQYKHLGGSCMLEADIKSIFEATSANSLDKDMKYIITGYFPSSALVDITIEKVKEYKQKGIFFLCDPILGDDGRLYTKPEVKESMKKLVLYADLITPNATELECLSDQKVNSVNDALQACSVLHNKGVKTIIVTSINDGDDIILLCSFYKQTDVNKNFKVKIHRLKGFFTGVGDTFTYTLFAWIKQGVPIPNAVNRTISTLQTIIKNTTGTDEINLIHSTQFLKSTDELFTLEYLN
ncbi:pyridoxine kinase, putative [Entamoeba invadens IP1]|uniref:pyridoxal kinase n=1 Tax=Entamoeba invadens IP1 TaxID=370355 RepID=A0A0A1U8Z8_ENTIV|nr:pyridoxine kinase, putative [Entamoeba invadens IP1]ELP88463.1 pyridoxine kinase, putative [Entamoeba invadens IP1]|eukprot:XP_004255234.1 pyridoxine kinase, putative [Entamoeba invadens IP1]